MSAASRSGVEVESTVDVEATHLVLEVFVRNRSSAPIRNVRIRPHVHRGGFSSVPEVKGLADLSGGRSGRAVFRLEPRGPDREAIDVSAGVGYVDALGSRHRRDAPRIHVDLALPALRPLAIDAEAFAERASQAFSHVFETASPSPASAAVQSAIDVLGALSLVPIEASATSSKEAPTRASLAGVDDGGVAHLIRIVAAPRGGGSVLRLTVFAESEVALFALYQRVREAVETAVR